MIIVILLLNMPYYLKSLITRDNFGLKKNQMGLNLLDIGNTSPLLVWNKLKNPTPTRLSGIANSLAYLAVISSSKRIKEVYS